MEYLTAEIIAALVTGLTAFGTGIKFVMVRMDRKQKALEDRQTAEQTRPEAERARHELKVEQERIRWEALMEDRIKELRREIRLQEHEIGYLRVVSDAYLRHIAALEGLMRSKGIEIPELKLPTYSPLEEAEEPIALEVVKPPRRRRRAAA